MQGTERRLLRVVGGDQPVEEAANLAEVTVVALQGVVDVQGQLVALVAAGGEGD